MPHGDWRRIYEERTVSAPRALAGIRSGARVFISAGCARPQTLVEELIGLPGKLADIELIHLMTFGVAPYTGSEYKDRFRHNALFIGSNVSEAVSEGRADYTPISKFKLARMLRTRALPLDAALIHVSPPNKQGYVSMGITVGVSKTAAQCAGYVVAAVNGNMPRTMGDSFLHVSEIDAFVPTEMPIIEAPPLEVDPVCERIAHHCSRLVENEATLHVGYNPVAFALAEHLAEREHLGVHTDILTSPVVELIRTGVIDNSKKTINQGKVVTSLCYGTKEIYDFIDDNPQIEFHPCEYVNNPFVIAQHERMIAITEGFKVDFSGMVAAKAIGPRFGSGFMNGAAHARHGKSIVVVRSTNEDETESNIVSHFAPVTGVGMSTNRDDVQYVVTEFGIAALEGRTIRERALALIHVAHPAFRGALLEQAKQRSYVYSDQILSTTAVYPAHLEHRHVLDDGQDIFVRPARPTDERAVQSFVYKLDEKSIQYRFHGTQHTMHHSRVQSFVNVDYEEEISAVALVVGEDGREDVVSMAQYLFYPANNQAEVAFITATEHQNRGIGTHMLEFLIRFARERGVDKLFAEVLQGNHQMLKVFHKSGVPMISKLEEGVYNVTLDLAVDEDPLPSG